MTNPRGDSFTHTEKAERMKDHKPFCPICYFPRLGAWAAGGKFHEPVKQKGAKKEGKQKASASWPPSPHERFPLTAQIHLLGLIYSMEKNPIYFIFISS